MEPGDVGRGDGIVVAGQGEGGVDRGEVRGDDRRGDIWLKLYDDSFSGGDGVTTIILNSAVIFSTVIP